MSDFRAEPCNLTDLQELVISESWEFSARHKLQMNTLTCLVFSLLISCGLEKRIQRPAFTASVALTGLKEDTKLASSKPTFPAALL